MKFRYIFQIFLLFLTIDLYAKDFNKNFFYCKQVPEGNPFGLIFKSNKVSQIGIDSFKMVYDYTENYTLHHNKIKWLNVTLNLEKYTLNIGNQSAYFAECKKVKSLSKLKNLLEKFIISQQYKNTI